MNDFIICQKLSISINNLKLRQFFLEAFNIFRKINKGNCGKIFNTTETLEQAIKLCTDDENCTMFYNDGCDHRGPFKICRSPQYSTDVSSRSCVYVKIADEESDVIGKYTDRRWVGSGIISIHMIASN